VGCHPANSAFTEEVSASAEEMSAQIEQMADQSLATTAETLQDLVAHFILEDGGPVTAAPAPRRPEARHDSCPVSSLRRAGLGRSRPTDTAPSPSRHAHRSRCHC